MQASFDVALQIAKCKKPHTIGEMLIKPCTLNMVKLILSKKMHKENLASVIINDIIKRRISLMSIDIKQQVMNEIKASPMFSLQLDKSIDVASCSQFLVFVRYVHMEDVKEEF